MSDTVIYPGTCKIMPGSVIYVQVTDAIPLNGKWVLTLACGHALEDSGDSSSPPTTAACPFCNRMNP